MSRQYFRELLAPVMDNDQTAVTGTAETALWPVSPFTATVANQLQPGQIYVVEAEGVATTPASAATTLTITPRWGTSSGGTSLGASAASSTVTASQTNVPWVLKAKLICRTVSSVASSSTLVLIGTFECAAINIPSLQFGGTVVTTADTTTAQGVYIGVTLGGSASFTATTRMTTFEVVN